MEKKPVSTVTVFLMEYFTGAANVNRPVFSKVFE
jgi:hypothetical protein